jgi:murein L,D-transpeptidase YafK
MIHQLMNHHINRRQRLDQKNGQGFGCGLWVHGEQSTARSLGGFDVGVRWEVEVESAFGGFVEFF